MLSLTVRLPAWTGVLLFTGVSIVASTANAAPIVLSFDATFSEPGFSTEFDNDLAVIPGLEITSTNGTNVGSLFFDDEYVDASSSASATALDYRIQGGGGAHPVNSSYSLTGWSAGTNLAFSDFKLDMEGMLIGVGVTVDQAGGLDRVIGALGGPLMAVTDYFFDPVTSSLTIFLAGLGVLEQPGQLPLGTMTFNLTFEAAQPAPVIPEPASLTLLGAGLAALAAARRRAGGKRASRSRNRDA